MRKLAVTVLQAMWMLGVQSAAQAGDPPAPAKAEAPAATPLVEADQLLSLKQAKGADLLLLDVRKPEEFAAGHVPGAINIPHDQLASRLSELPRRDKPVVVYCRSGRRAALAEDVLRQAGYTDVQHLKGDMLGWEAEGRPVEK